MTPFPLTFYIYAHNETEVKELQQALYDFIRSKADRGVAVSATKVASALRTYGNNPLVNNYFK